MELETLPGHLHVAMKINFQFVQDANMFQAPQLDYLVPKRYWINKMANQKNTGETKKYFIWIMRNNLALTYLTYLTVIFQLVMQ